MTASQFQALALLLRIRNGKSREAARMVLVDGQSSTSAAKATGLTLSGVSNAVYRIRRGMHLASAARD